MYNNFRRTESAYFGQSGKAAIEQFYHIAYYFKFPDGLYKREIELAIIWQGTRGLPHSATVILADAHTHAENIRHHFFVIEQYGYFGAGINK